MNDVTCGEVCLLFTIASAMILRTLSIWIISSPSFNLIDAETGAAASGVGFGVAATDVVETAWIAAGAIRFATNDNISSLVILPSKPLPLMDCNSLSEIFSFCAIDFTNGDKYKSEPSKLVAFFVFSKGASRPFTTSGSIFGISVFTSSADFGSCG